MQHSAYDQILELHPAELIAWAVPPRSRLYPLEPIGTKSPNVECLTGYAARLADKHHVTLSNLMTKEVRPALGKPPVATGVALYLEADKAVNGIGSTAADLVRAFEDLTLQRKLKYTTMLPWKDLLSSRLLIRPNRAWCPACYEESADAGDVYDQLIWTLSAVSACAKHRRRLETVCSHCGREQAHMAFHSRPGHCHRCKRWLNGEEKLKANVERSILPPTEKEVWITEQVGELLTMVPTLPMPLTRDSFAEGLLKCVEESAHGRISSFAFDLSITYSTIRVWLRQTQAPILGLLLEICFRLKKRLSDLILCKDNPSKGNHDPALKQDGIPLLYVKDVARHEGVVDWGVVENELRRATTEYPPISLTQIVNKLRLSKKKLKLNFPELTARIIERSRDYYHPPLDNEQAEQALIVACVENPPPSLSDIAKRLGRTGGIASLRQKFPEQCRKIVARWRAHRKRSLDYEEIEKQLRAILNENPPPSFVAVARRLNISRGLLATKFKELAAMISSRFNAHRQEVKESRRAVLAEAVPRICRDLIAEGLYPSRERVSARLSKLGRCEVSETLRMQTIEELKLK